MGDNAFSMVKGDLEEVVREEVNRLVGLIDCQVAKVVEDSSYFWFMVESNPKHADSPGLVPVTIITYYPKFYVTVLVFKVEFVDEDTKTMALVRYYFTPMACFKDHVISHASIEDVARIIVGDSNG